MLNWKMTWGAVVLGLCCAGSLTAMEAEGSAQEKVSHAELLSGLLGCFGNAKPVVAGEEPGIELRASKGGNGIPVLSCHGQPAKELYEIVSKAFPASRITDPNYLGFQVPFGANPEETRTVCFRYTSAAETWDFFAYACFVQLNLAPAFSEALKELGRQPLIGPPNRKISPKQRQKTVEAEKKTEQSGGDEPSEASNDDELSATSATGLKLREENQNF